jgi:hypothetical protein
VSDIDRAIDRLRDRLRQIGARDTTEPGDTTGLQALSSAIRPLQLPEALTRWWATVDTGSLPFQAWPTPRDPDFALQLWRSYQEEFPGVVPRCLVAAAYDAHVVVSVEANQRAETAGDVIRWAVDDWGSYRYVAASWAHVVECYVDVIDAGAYEFVQGTAVLDTETLDAAIRARLSEAEVAQRFPGRDVYLPDASQWPPRWQPQ